MDIIKWIGIAVLMLIIDGFMKDYLVVVAGIFIFVLFSCYGLTEYGNSTDILRCMGIGFIIAFIVTIVLARFIANKDIDRINDKRADAWDIYRRIAIIVTSGLGLVMPFLVSSLGLIAKLIWAINTEGLHRFYPDTIDGYDTSGEPVTGDYYATMCGTPDCVHMERISVCKNCSRRHTNGCYGWR
ncbi:hypothetical protein [Oribacterium sp. FC2011]|uniref:hypothetical protein n=1 Tax=Oribacterium sp. FC2011 TaxID=1408311 RepID=UPI0004E178B2|nr:hypothetical protein [Oribacterium sp. FC2011]